MNTPSHAQAAPALSPTGKEAVPLSDRLAYIEAARALMERMGVRLRTGTCFDTFASLCAAQPARGTVNPSFDPREPEGARLSGLWLAGFDRDGTLVHTQAMRRVDLSGSTLGRHLRMQGDRYRIRGYDLDMRQARISLTAQAEHLTGTVGYHGELWSLGGHAGLRGDGCLPILSRLMLMETIVQLEPTHVFGFISPTNACRGLAARLGYMHLEQRSVVYPRLDGGAPLEGWMVWMSHAEIDFNLRVEPEFFARILGRSDTSQDGRVWEDVVPAA